MIDADEVAEFIRLRKDGRLYHRESQVLEFKEQFNFAGLAEYCRDFAAFANNRGGHIIFGVTDTPRVPSGLSAKSVDQLRRLDPERITRDLIDVFDPEIRWHFDLVEIDGKHFGAFQALESKDKPVIAKKNEGRDQVIKNGEIYYRYGGRTQVIRYAELASIIRHRIEQNNTAWLDLMGKIGRTGPANAAVLDLDRPAIQKEENEILVVDEDLAEKLNFIKEGEFEERTGSPTLKLIGDVVPVEQVEVVRRVRENLTKRYLMTARTSLTGRTARTSCTELILRVRFEAR